MQRFDGNGEKIFTHIVADFVQPVLSQMEGLPNYCNSFSPVANQMLSLKCFHSQLTSTRQTALYQKSDYAQSNNHKWQHMF